MSKEKETTINWMPNDKFAEVFSNDKTVEARLKSAGFESGTGDNQHFYRVPVESIKFGNTQDRRGRKNLTDDQRRAIGIRLQTARAGKFGLTLEQFKSLKLRPGVAPTAEQVTSLTSTEAPKPKRVRKAKVPAATAP